MGQRRRAAAAPCDSFCPAPFAITTVGFVDVDIQEYGEVARVAAVSADGMQMWLQLASGGGASVTSREAPLEFRVGTVLLVDAYENRMEAVPDELWPADERTGEPQGGELWVGVVKLRLDDITIVDVGGRWRRVPTNGAVPYDRGNTVEGTDATGIGRVLDRKPLLYGEPAQVDETVISRFRHEPSQDLTFDDFGGLPDVVRRARELIEVPLQHREELRQIGAPPIKGVLLTGDPGTGKTMLARIIASVAGATFYEISGPTIFSKWYGESEEILRRIFADARQRAPSIIFFDEIDSVAGQRDEEAHEASKRVVGQLLTLMDGFTGDTAVTVVAATNRPQDIDVALRRPGRFDWQIHFPLPSRDDREEILRVSGQALSTDDALPHDWVAENTEGWSAAALAGIWREAALLAAADSRGIIMLEDYLEGHARVAAQRRRVEAERRRVEAEAAAS